VCGLRRRHCVCHLCDHCDNCTQHRSTRVGCSRREESRHGQCHALDGSRHVHWFHWTNNLYFCETPRCLNSMCALQWQKAPSQRQMSSMRQRLKTPQFWLGVFGALLLAVLGDTCRAPSRQVSANLYGGLVNSYRWTKSQLGVQPRCRFMPSCSQYSQQAVRRHGVWKGLDLTYARLCRCRTDVPLGTHDPTPEVLPYRSRSEIVE
jgi:putative membrane protein insertion efficiency factor